jgi:hypothetical protein
MLLPPRLIPPIFTRQNLVLVTSTSLTGSQKDIGIPTLGIGDPQVHKISFAFGVSSPDGDTFIPHIVIGNIQLQQISDTGFTNLP